jgi:hypothetical protein
MPSIKQIKEFMRGRMHEQVFNETYEILRQVSGGKNLEPTDPEDLTIQKRTFKPVIIYDRLATERPDLEILTNRNEYTNITQKIKYRCTLCGYESEARWDRLLPKTAGSGFPFFCTKCKENRKKALREEWFWQRSLFYINKRKGKLVSFTQKEEYPTIKDEVVIKCVNGHLFRMTQRELQKGSWCYECRNNPSVEISNEKFPDLRKIKDRALFYCILQINLPKKADATLLFPVPDKNENLYYVQCNHCKEIELISDTQIQQRKYICHNRCAPSNLLPMSLLIVEFGIFADINNYDSKMAHLNEVYRQGLEKYREWKKNA